MKRNFLDLMVFGIVGYTSFSFQTISDSENAPSEIRFCEGQYLNYPEEKY